MHSQNSWNDELPRQNSPRAPDRKAWTAACRLSTSIKQIFGICGCIRCRLRTMPRSGAAEYGTEQLTIRTSAPAPSRNSRMGGISLGHENTSKPRFLSEPANSWLSSCLESASNTLIPFEDEALSTVMAYPTRDEIVRSEENVAVENFECSDQRTLRRPSPVENSNKHASLREFLEAGLATSVPGTFCALSTLQARTI